MNNYYHTIIIGGGAAGMCAAILLKRKLNNEKILIIEALDRVGKKLIVTGNGRCNITNSNIKNSCYHSENNGFFNDALEKYSLNFTKEFFSSIGVPLTEGENGKMYPFSLQASSVVDALRLEINDLGVDLKLGCKCNQVIYSKNDYTVKTTGGDFVSKNIIIATGGLAGGKAYGCDGSGYNLLKSLGFGLVKTTPSIVQLKTKTESIKALKGIKVNAEVSLYCNDKLIRTENGELLFTDYGISGPAVLQISREVSRLKGNIFVKINFFKSFSYSDLNSILTNRVSVLNKRKCEHFFVGLLPKMLGHTILKLSGINLSDSVCVIDNKKCKKIASLLNSFTLEVVGTKGFDMAQVTAGGIDTKDFSSKTMESIKYKNLYAVGEVLDVDGDCGGFNLQWAWASAALATEGIISKYK